jgi:hypothetical protein
MCLPSHFLRPFQLLVDLLRCLVHQEGAAAEENQVTSGEGMIEHPEELRRQRGKPVHGEEESQAGDAGDGEAEKPRAVLFFLREFPGEDGDEDDVVDAEHDLHQSQCCKTRPGRGIAENFEH